MKQYIISFLLWAFASVVVAQDFPDDIYMMPLGDDLPDHQWSFKQGLDFDVFNFKNSKGTGVYMYVGVNKNTAITTDSYIDAIIMGKPVKLYKKCDGTADCRYSTTVKAGRFANGNDLWTQIWVKPTDKKDITTYVNWLANLRFHMRS